MIPYISYSENFKHHSIPLGVLLFLVYEPLRLIHSIGTKYDTPLLYLVNTVIHVSQYVTLI